MKTKIKTHSGAKKRLQLLPGGKVKRKQTRTRHLLSSKSKKRKRHLRDMSYVHPTVMKHVARLLVF